MHSLLSKIIDFLNVRKYTSAFILGFITALALPPFYILPLAIIGFSGLLIILDNTNNKTQSFITGWWFGFGHFIMGLYWISFALLVDFKTFGWLMPFAIFGIAGIVAFYPAFVSFFTYIYNVKGYKKVLVFGALWTLFEYLRGILFTGFPWNLIGYSWTISDSMLQIVSITGIYGLSLITVTSFSTPYCLKYSNKRPAITAAIIITLIFSGGYYRLSTANFKPLENVRIRIIQPNISQTIKWDENHARDIVYKYYNMTKSEGFDKITHVIWPESALPFYIEDNAPIIDFIKDAIPKNGALITGSMHHNVSSGGFTEKVWNSIHVINNQGKIEAIYDKNHLVPFGEYVPFRSILPIDKITHGMLDFSQGDGLKTIKIDNFPNFSPLICYEAIFPNEVTNHDDTPQLIVNVTNDGWYGYSSGPFQHFQMTRVRAIEEGAQLIRVANTGISAIIDPYGQIVAKTNLQEEAILDSYILDVPVQKTTYNRVGNKIALLMIFIVVLLVHFIKEN